jgi:hypothetical protein
MNARVFLRIDLEARVSFWRLLFLAFIMGIAGVVPAPSQAQTLSEKPLPTLDDFLKEVRTHLRSDRLLLSHYTYTEKVTVRALDGKGKVKSTHESVYEVYPSFEPGLTYRRRIAKDGKPIRPQDLEKQDREQDKKLREHAKKVEDEGTGERERRQAKEAEEKRKEETAIDEMFQLYRIKMEGREVLNEHPTIILSFQPQPGYKPRTDEAKILARVAGRAWFSEADHELVRIEVKVIDNISFGWGVLARLNKGATGILQRRKINDEIWLPADVQFTGSARLLLVKGLNVDFSSQYSDFLKFTVETQVKFRKDK